jgi:hypothetical protein
MRSLTIGIAVALALGLTTASAHAQLKAQGFSGSTVAPVAIR